MRELMFPSGMKGLMRDITIVKAATVFFVHFNLVFCFRPVNFVKGFMILE